MSRVVRWPLGLLLMVQIVFAFWVAGAANLITRSTSSEFVPANVTPSALPLTLENSQELAEQHARGWSEDARLISATMRVEWPLESLEATTTTLPSGGWMIYAFSDGESLFSLYLDRRTGVYITSATAPDSGAAWPSLNFTAPTRSSTTAVLAAEILNGTEYRAACPGTRSTTFVTLGSARDDSGADVTVWTVTYGDARFPGTHDVLLQLDVATGNVVRSDVRQRPCADGD